MREGVHAENGRSGPLRVRSRARRGQCQARDTAPGLDAGRAAAPRPL